MGLWFVGFRSGSESWGPVSLSESWRESLGLVVWICVWVLWGFGTVSYGLGLALGLGDLEACAQYTAASDRHVTLKYNTELWRGLGFPNPKADSR